MFSLSTNALRIGCLSSVKLFRVANSNFSNLCSSNFKLPGLHISSGGTGVVAAATAAKTINQRCFADQKQPTEPIDMENKKETMRVNKEELKKRLTPMQYQVTQEAATERPFTGCYNKHYEKGVYQCIVCHQDLFSSDTKYDAGCGWPAFNDVLDKGKITLHRDASIPERIRTEVRCAQCNAHMGHVFEDGPKPTRKRYCINSAAIEFLAADELNSRAKSGAAATVGTPIAQQ